MSAPTPVHAVVREQGKEHIPIYPKGFIAIRIVQLVFAVVIMGLAGYSVSATIPVLNSNVFILVVALFTLITSIYHIVAHFGPPQAYNYWATLALDIFLIIMWLAGFAVVASDTSVLAASGYAGGSRSSRTSFSSSSTYYVYVFWYTMAASAGLGGLQFVLHIVSLIIHSIRLHQHRAAGLHCMPGSLPTPPGGVAAAAAPGAEKTAAGGNVAQGFAPVAPAYAPYPGQPGQQPIPVFAGPPPPGAIPVPYGGIPQQQQQQQQPQAYPAYPIQQQGQVPIQTTGGSYQQGPPVPLFAQTTGGSSTIPSQPSGQQQQQQGPQGVVPPQQQQHQHQQPIQSELAGNQPVYGQPQN